MTDPRRTRRAGAAITAAWLTGTLAVASTTAGCTGKESLVTVVGPGVVNDPRNRTLRFDILQFGLSQLCREMRVMGVPLQMRDDEPVSGRFFADTCGSQVIDEDERQSLVLQFSGRGYAYSSITRRVGFTASGVVEYSPDFQLHDGAMYVYFRPRNVTAAEVQTVLIESGAAASTITKLGVNANEVGSAVVRAQLQRGFTVIRRNANGEVAFGLGFVPEGEVPFVPFMVERSAHLTLANGTTEVHSGQQDYLGGFEITKKRQALHVTATLDGAAAVDLFVVPKAYADQMTGSFVTQPGPAALTAPPVFEEPLVAGPQYRRTIPLPVGIYYLVIDNSAEVGRTAPSGGPTDDRAAKVDFLVQLGKARH
ncbi:MAG: hypothetical protein JW751_20080 [Polyangiaceae bacterium]|nr:hypothetical protein [Polyangiaceae bacterium]